MNLKKQRKIAIGALTLSLGVAAAGAGLLYGGFGGMLIAIGITWGIYAGIDLFRLMRAEEQAAVAKKDEPDGTPGSPDGV